MRRINQIISGHNYYRKANEIEFIDKSNCSSLGCLDDIKSRADGERLDHARLLRPIETHTYPDSAYPVVSNKGIFFTAPSSTDYNKRIFLTDVTFTGLFDFQFDVTVVAGVGLGDGVVGGVRMYTDWPNLTGYWDTALTTNGDTYFDGHTSLMMPTDAANWGDNVSTGYATTKKRMIRISSTTYNLYGWANGGWRIHDWQSATKTNAYGKNVRLAFYHYNRSSTQYATAVLNNFVLNSGQTQIAW